jgi:hypothetical protein
VEINENRAKRRGRTALDDPRTHCVSVRLNDEELAILNAKRGTMKQGEWIRCAALDKLPPIVPEPNIEKWQALARAAANLNQIARSLKDLKGISDEQFAQVRKVLTDFRASLLGVSNEGNAEN